MFCDCPRLACTSVFLFAILFVIRCCVSDTFYLWHKKQVTDFCVIFQRSLKERQKLGLRGDTRKFKNISMGSESASIHTYLTSDFPTFIFTKLEVDVFVLRANIVYVVCTVVQTLKCKRLTDSFVHIRLCVGSDTGEYLTTLCTLLYIGALESC